MKHLMEVLLSQELFQDQNQFWENGELVNEVHDDFNSFHTRSSVETDINFNLCLSVGELNDRNGGLISGVNGVLDSNVCLL